MLEDRWLMKKRTTGVIVLSNGDVTKGDSVAMAVSETVTNLLLQLFDCFE